jgi:ribosomal protein S18 acetylase RimI-like enzyme
MTITYRTNAATIDELADHLRRCDDGYVPPLSERVAIDEYAQKLVDRATRFEAWQGDLVGLVAAYLPGEDGDAVFITNVSVVREVRGHGVATALLGQCADLARLHSIARIRLEVDHRNDPAIGLYQASGFQSIAQTGDIVTMERLEDAAGVHR